MKQRLLLAIITASLTACGGGGGGGSPSVVARTNSGEAFISVEGKSVSQLNNSADSLIQSAYSGNEDSATLAESDIADISFDVIRQVIIGGDLSALNASPSVEIPDLTPAFKSIGDFASAAQEYTLLTQSIEVDESDSCDNSGTLSIKGVLSDSGIGGLVVTFDNCSLGGVLFDGISAIYFHDAFGDTASIYYDEMSITTGGQTFEMTGRILDDPFTSFGDREYISDLVLVNTATGEEQRIEGWGEPAFTDQYWGIYYHDELGYVEVNEGLSFVVSSTDVNGTLLLTNAAGHTLEIVFDATDVTFRLDNNADDIFDVQATVTKAAFFNDQANLVFTPI